MEQKMSSEFYNVYVDDNCVAENMPLQFALILTKAIYTEFYAEPKLKVTIERIPSGTESEEPIKAEEINE